MQPITKPWWEQVTALVTLSVSGAITGFSFVPRSAAELKSPAGMPIHLMALERSAQAAPADESTLRTAIINVTNHFLRVAAGKTPAEMEALIWHHDSVNGVDHGASCAAFASLTLELASRAVGQQSWVTGGTSYPWPLHKWVDARVEPNPASIGITSIVQDAQAHHRWHPLGDGYQPLPGDWVLFDGHVEVVTGYASGVLDTVGADSLPNFSVNAHQYRDPLAAHGVAGFVNNGELTRMASPLPGSGGRVPGQHRNQATADHRASTPAGQGQPPGGTLRGAGPGVQRAHAPGGHSGRLVASPEGVTGSGQSGGGQRARDQPQASLTIPGAPVAGAAPPAAAGAAPPAVAGAGPPAVAGAPIAGSPARQAPGDQHAALQSAPKQPQRGPAHRPVRTAPQPTGAEPGAAPSWTAASHTASTPPRAAAPAAPRAAAPGALSIPGLPAAGPGPAHGQDHAAPHRARAVPARDSGQRAGQPGSPGGPATAPIPGLPASGLTAATLYRRHDPAAPARAVNDTPAQQAFIAKVAPGAIAAQRRYGVPAAVTIAQAIDESGWGQSPLAMADHNLFGIKGAGPAGSVVLPTQEYQNGQLVSITAPFRVYYDIAGSIEDHGKLLATSPYYRQAMAQRQDPNAFAAALTGIYATDPQYGAKLIELMRRYDLYRYDRIAPAPVAHRATPSQGAHAAPGQTAQVAPKPAPAPASPSPAPGVVPPQPTAAGAGRNPTAHPGGPRSVPDNVPIPGAPAPAAQRAVAQPHVPAPRRAVQPHGQATGHLDSAQAASSAAAVALVAAPAAMRRQTQPTSSRPGPSKAARYRAHLPGTVSTALITTAKMPLLRSEPLYRDIAKLSGIRWELLAACDWMQCQARPGYSPARGEKLGTLNPDGTIYRTRSEALEQCAYDLVELAGSVYQIDAAAPGELSVGDLASVFAAFRWGGLLLQHHTSAMEFPYSVAGLTVEHLNMRWPNIADPNTPDKAGGRFRKPFGAVPIVLSLHYQATV